MQALEECRFSDARALRLVADLWRSVSIDDQLHCGDLEDHAMLTMAHIEAAGVMPTPRPEVIGLLTDSWPFPMYSFDLSVKRVKQADLRAVQANYNPW